MEDKISRLKNILIEMESVVVAFSGGVDSTLLLKIATDTLGAHALGVTAVSASMPTEERLEAETLAQQVGARHVMIETHETDDPSYQANTPNRCYFCKSHVYDKMLEFARQAGYRAVVDGTNLDDAGDHRPGRQAARERGVRSPLQEAGFNKQEIRDLARALGLPNWDKPSAACISSRIPYGTAITLEMLSQVEQAEAALHRMGFRQVRVRHHDQVARIEVDPQELAEVLARREEIIPALKAAGYTYVTLDLMGFRSGSMNEVLTSSGR